MVVQEGQDPGPQGWRGIPTIRSDGPQSRAGHRASACRSPRVGGWAEQRSTPPRTSGCHTAGAEWERGVGNRPSTQSQMSSWVLSVAALAACGLRALRHGARGCTSVRRIACRVPRRWARAAPASSRGDAGRQKAARLSSRTDPSWPLAVKLHPPPTLSPAYLQLCRRLQEALQRAGAGVEPRRQVGLVDHRLHQPLPVCHPPGGKAGSRVRVSSAALS